MLTGTVHMGRGLGVGGRTPQPDGVFCSLTLAVFCCFTPARLGCLFFLPVVLSVTTMAVADCGWGVQRQKDRY